MNGLIWVFRRKKRHAESLVMCVYANVRRGERIMEADESWCGASESGRDGGSQQQCCL